MREKSLNERTGVTETSIPNTVVHDFFCKKENKYKASTLAGETAVSVEFSHREQREHEREREFVCS